ncbi:MAG: hypothetical protein QNK05_12330 [Myxococcota bacterium]|nr:hypothetical protein [Myxococcota bacterium]
MVATLCFAVSVILACYVGARIVRVGLRTRQASELTVGGSTLCLALGQVSLLAAREWLAPGGVALGLWILGFTLVALSVPLLAIGIRRIFRPDASWAAGLAAALSVATAVWYGATLWLGPEAARPTLLLVWIEVVRIALFSWTAFESFRYGVLMRRRARLGLAQHSMASRFLWWGLATSCQCIDSATGILSAAFLGQSMLQLPLGLFAASSLALLASLSLWFAFFPPRLLTRFGSNRSGPPGAPRAPAHGSVGSANRILWEPIR